MEDRLNKRIVSKEIRSNAVIKERIEYVLSQASGSEQGKEKIDLRTLLERINRIQWGMKEREDKDEAASSLDDWSSADSLV